MSMHLHKDFLKTDKLESKPTRDGFGIGLAMAVLVFGFLAFLDTVQAARLNLGVSAVQFGVATTNPATDQFVDFYVDVRNSGTTKLEANSVILQCVRGDFTSLETLEETGTYALGTNERAIEHNSVARIITSNAFDDLITSQQKISFSEPGIYEVRCYVITLEKLFEIDDEDSLLNELRPVSVAIQQGIKPSIELTGPSADTILFEGDTYTISWNAIGVTAANTVTIKTESDDFLLANDIAKSIPNTGKYSWRIEPQSYHSSESPLIGQVNLSIAVDGYAASDTSDQSYPVLRSSAKSLNNNALDMWLNQFTNLEGLSQYRHPIYGFFLTYPESWIVWTNEQTTKRQLSNELSNYSHEYIFQLGSGERFASEKYASVKFSILQGIFDPSTEQKLREFNRLQGEVQREQIPFTSLIGDGWEGEFVGWKNRDSTSGTFGSEITGYIWVYSGAYTLHVEIDFSDSIANQQNLVAEIQEILQSLRLLHPQPRPRDIELDPTLPRPDLIVDFVDAFPTIVETDDSVVIKTTVRNIGDTKSDSTNILIRSSLNPGWSNSAFVPALDIGEQVNISQLISAHHIAPSISSSDNSTIFVTVDSSNSVLEKNNLNNDSEIILQMYPEPEDKSGILDGIDLSIVGTSYDLNGKKPGDRISMNLSVRNYGSQSSPQTTAHITTIGINGEIDSQVITIPQVQSNEMISVPFSVPTRVAVHPHSLLEYVFHVGSFINPSGAVPEADGGKNNNSFVFGLLFDAASQSFIAPSFNGLTDLMLIAETEPSDPQPGDTITMRVTIHNIGNETAPATHVVFGKYANSSFVPILSSAQFDVQSLRPGESSFVSYDFLTGAGDIAAYLRVIVNPNANFIEKVSTNNWQNIVVPLNDQSIPEPISIPSPDLKKIGEERLIRMKSDGKVYAIINGKKHWIPNEIVFTRDGYRWEDVQEVDRSVHDSYPRVRLIRLGDQPDVWYVTDRGQKRRVSSEQVFLSYGNQWKDVVSVSVDNFSAYANNVLIKLAGDSRVYRISGGTKRWIQNEAVFDRSNYRWEDVAPVNQVEFNTYETGEPLL